ncbi:DUF4023 domain-containing protein [Paenibacillus lycopersici]|uniref:DUF4023 domain-containing protein n=1 Tax=Paenibacillus lycopersici TaxID=2704462 RepID=A0A6C0G302_9BACL|nr:DUF4023 domain-containing protein [Paenibacillus lycopersici]QHT60990.1 DUF4023 domain-containing protein [Paenibacillus lycopersici]
MDSTNEFVNKVQDTQAKQQKNKENYGKGTPTQKLQNKQHTNNP